MSNFRFFALVIILLISGNVFSQTDSSYKTEDIYSISYKNSLNKISEYENIRLSYLDSISLRFEKKMYENGKWVTYSYRINFENINSFGYKAHATSGQNVIKGALIGFGTGFILGVIAGRIDIAPHPTKFGEITLGERLGTGLGLGLITTIPAMLISLGIPSKPYENLNISKYDVKMKFELIKKLIKKGAQHNL